MFFLCILYCFFEVAQEMKLNSKGPWQPLLNQWKPMIENDIPYISLDFLEDDNKTKSN